MKILVQFLVSSNSYEKGPVTFALNNYKKNIHILLPIMARFFIVCMCLYLHIYLHIYFVFAKSEGSGESVHLRSLARVFAARTCDKTILT